MTAATEATWDVSSDGILETAEAYGATNSPFTKSTTSNDVADGIFLYYPIAIMVVGLTLNCIAFATFQSKNLRDVINTLYYRSDVWADNVILLLHGLPSLASVLLKDDVLLSRGFCKAVKYLVQVSLLYAHWSLVLTCLERTMGVFRPIHTMIHWTKKTAWNTFFLLGVISLLLNIPAIFVYDIQPGIPDVGIHEEICGSFVTSKDDGYAGTLAYHAIYFILLIVIPLILVVVLNAALNWKLRSPRPGDQENPVPAFLLTSMSKILLTLMVTTFLFVSPFTLYDILVSTNALGYPDHVDEADRRRLTLAILYTIALGARGIKFFSFRFICPKFRGEFLKMFCCYTSEQLKSQASAYSTATRTSYVSQVSKNAQSQRRKSSGVVVFDGIPL